LLEAAEPGTTFTVWRKIYLDYAWMEDRNGQFPDCSWGPESEWIEDFQISNGDFQWIKNTYDDCFIEIEPTGRITENTEYQYAISIWTELVTYGDSQTDFRPPPHDTVLLLGVDHLYRYAGDECMGPVLGTSVPYFWYGFPDNAYYNYCAVGQIKDNERQGIDVWMDGGKRRTYDKLILAISSHELGHCLAARSTPMDNEKPYGLMNSVGDVMDSRSYFHEDHIIDLRSELLHFDASNH
jgi:hypothetical protein